MDNNSSVSPETIAKEISAYLVVGMNHTSKDGQNAIAEIIRKNLNK